MRESVAAALGANLDDDPWRERPLDRVAAFCFADRLGTLLWRCKYQNDAKAYKPASLLLARELPQGMTLGFRRRLASQALTEWIFPVCRRCFGAKEVVIGNLRATCPACNGLGLHRWGDLERAQAVKIRDVARVGRHFVRLFTVLAEFDRRVAAIVRAQLERLQ